MGYHKRWRPVTMIVGVGIVVTGIAGGTSRPLSVQASEGAYRLVENWPQVPRWMKWESGAGVAVDAKGIVYYLHRDSGQISKWNQAGKYLGDLSPYLAHAGFAKGAHTLTIEADGSFWVVERDRHQVKKYAADGATVLVSLGTDSKYGEAENLFNGPTGVVTLPSGEYVVSDGYWNSRLVWFSKEGKFLKAVGKWGRGPAEFGGVHGIALDTRGRLLVADICKGDLHPEAWVTGQVAPYRTKPLCTGGRIQVLDQQGKHLTDWAYGGTPLSILPFADRVYVGGVYPRIVIYDPNTGKEIGSIDGASDAHQMAMDAQGDIYISSIAKRSENPDWAPLRRFTRRPK